MFLFRSQVAFLLACAVATVGCSARPGIVSVDFHGPVTPFLPAMAYLGQHGIAVSQTGESRVQIPNTVEVRTKLADYGQLLRQRLALINENIVNAETLSDEAGLNRPYRRQVLLVKPNGTSEVIDDPSPPRLEYRPEDPLAGPSGYVRVTNIEKAIEVTERTNALQELHAVSYALSRFGK